MKSFHLLSAAASVMISIGSAWADTPEKLDSDAIIDMFADKDSVSAAELKEAFRQYEFCKLNMSANNTSDDDEETDECEAQNAFDEIFSDEEIKEKLGNYIPTLLELAKDNNNSVRDGAFSALESAFLDAYGNEKLDKNQLKEVAVLIASEKDPSVLDTAIHAVREFMVDEPELWKAIKGHMNSDSAEVRGRVALNIILATDAMKLDGAMDYLYSMLTQDKSKDNRELVCKQLGTIADYKFLEPALDMLKNKGFEYCAAGIADWWMQKGDEKIFAVWMDYAKNTPSQNLSWVFASQMDLAKLRDAPQIKAASWYKESDIVDLLKSKALDDNYLAIGRTVVVNALITSGDKAMLADLKNKIASGKASDSDKKALIEKIDSALSEM